MGSASRAHDDGSGARGVNAAPGSTIAEVGRALRLGREVVVTPDGKLAPVERPVLGRKARALHWFGGAGRRITRRRVKRAASPVVIHIGIDQLRRMEEEARSRDGYVETGGALIGTRRSPFEIVVAESTLPGENAIQGALHFTADVEHVQARLDALAEDGHSLVGGWHLHPHGDSAPSPGDLATMKHEVDADGAHPFFVQIIVTLRDGAFAARAFIYENGRLAEVILRRQVSSGHFRRLDGVVNQGVLHGKTLLIAGLGSGGSMTAITLAQAGVGGFLLLDPDALEEGNTVRHAAGLRYVGQNKAAVVADLIQDRNPGAAAVALPEPLGDDPERAIQLMGLVDLVVCAVDAESARRKIARLARKANKPVLIAGAYAGAIGGDCILVRGRDGPCYSCSTNAIVGSEDILEDMESETKTDYGAAHAGLVPQSGLGADIELIATLSAKWVLRILDPSPAEPHWEGLNYFVWGNRAGMELKPLTIELGRIERDPSCLECGNSHGHRPIEDDQARTRAKDFLADLETAPSRIEPGAPNPSGSSA